MIFANYVALDITSSEIRAVAVNMGKVKKWASAPLPQDVVKAGVIRDPQTLGIIIDSLFHVYHLNKGRVIVTVTGLPFIYRTVSMPAGQRIATEAIERESRREMAITKDDMYISWQQTEKLSNSGEVNYFVIGIPRSSLNPVMEALAAASIKPDSIDIKPLALARAAAQPEALVVSLEDDYVDIVLVAGGLVRVMHSFNLSEKAVAGGALVNEIVAGLARAIKAFERDFPRLTLDSESAVLFSGSASAEQPLLDNISAATGREVKMISSVLAAPKGMSSGAYLGVLGLVAKKQTAKWSRPSFMRSAGSRTAAAAHGEAGYRDINIDLLAGFHRVHPGRFQLIFVVAALLSLVLAAVVFKTYDLKQGVGLEVATLQQEAALVTHGLTVAQTENQASLKVRQESVNQSQAISQQLAGINHLNDLITSRRLDYANRITAISAAVPSGARFDTIDFDSLKITVRGSAVDGFTVLNMVAALEKEAYFGDVRLEQLSPEKENGVYFKLSIANKTTVADLSGGTVQ
jgi:hypothetical protein